MQYGLYAAGGRNVLPTGMCSPDSPCHVTVGNPLKVVGATVRYAETVRYAKTVRQLIDYPGCLGARRRGNHSLSGGHNWEA